ncbi:MAG: TetR family transcriptional regulator [Alphaproteobacteria bacterium]|nr:TetR family transcriptional regulator [Alphaproteobacteria bacterium]
MAQESRAPRGRPRSEHLGAAIRAAARRILATEGYQGLTFEAVAAAAGVAKTTVYRRYADRVALIIDIADDLLDAQPEADTGSLRSDLELTLHATAEAFADPVTAAMIAAVVGEMAHDERLAESMRTTVIARRIAVMGRVFGRAIARSEIPTGTEWWLHAQRVIGPVMMRTLLTHEPIDDALIERLVSLELRSLGLSEPGRA